MPKSSKTKTQKARATRSKAEPFSVTAERLGHALADVIAHPNCPDDVEDAISELDCRIFNRYSDVEINLRYGFAQRLVGMLEKQRA